MIEFLRNVNLLSRCADYLTHQIESKMPLVPVDAAVLRPPRPSLVARSPEETFTVAVCGEEEVHSYHEAGITEILTCVSPERPVFRPTWPSVRNHLIIRCDDVEEPFEHYVCPNVDHVRQMIQFGRETLQRSQRDSNVRLLVHCAAGISRSTAATLLILAMKYGKGAEATAMRHLTTIRPICRPNAVIVSLGDQLLEREGRLVDQVTLWKTRHHAAIQTA